MKLQTINEYITTKVTEGIKLIHTYTDNTHKKLTGTGELTGKKETKNGVPGEYVRYDGHTTRWVPMDQIKLVEAIDSKTLADLYSKLNKGDIINISYDNAFQKGNKRELIVSKGKTIVGKSKVERITLVSTKNKKGVKYYFYNRKSGYIGFAVGDMAASITNISLNESRNSNNHLDGLDAVFQGKGKHNEKIGQISIENDNSITLVMGGGKYISNVSKNDIRMVSSANEGLEGNLKDGRTGGMKIKNLQGLDKGSKLLPYQKKILSAQKSFNNVVSKLNRELKLAKEKQNTSNIDSLFAEKKTYRAIIADNTALIQKMLKR